MALDFQVPVFDSVSNVTINMPLIDARAAVATSATRWSIVTSALASVFPVAPATVAGNQVGINFRNLIDGGDFTVNPWQRGTAFSNIGGTSTFTADRWALVAGTSSSASVTKTASTSVPGFSQALVFGRGLSSGSVSTIILSQTLETNDSIKLQNGPATLSFWAMGNSGFLAPTTGSAPNMGVTLYTGTGTDQSGSAMVNNTWTSNANAISTTVALTAVPQRFAFTGYIGSAVTQVGVGLQYIPSGTATTGETIAIWGVQLESGAAVSPFEHRDVEVELQLAQRYFYQVNEPATGVVVASGFGNLVNSATFVLPMPTQMRVAPTVSVTNGSFGVSIAGTGYQALTSFTAGTTHTPNYITVFGSTTLASGLAALLVGGSANQGKIQASADL